MTEQNEQNEPLKIYHEMQEYFGEKLVDFEIFPRVFMFQYRLFKYFKEKCE